MQDKTINNALLELRRMGGTQGKLAETLLELRGVPLPRVCKQRFKSFERNELRELVFAALADGPKLGGQIVAYAVTQRPDVPYDVMQSRLSTRLWTLQRKGRVCRDGVLWSRP